MSIRGKKTLGALIDRVEAARVCGHTCSASRHVQQLADELGRYGRSYAILDDPLECAESMLATVAALWEARSELAALKGRADGEERP